jgi:F0F1-type ATP synthase alpha subunit
MTFEKQVLVLYAALNDYFNKYEPEQMQEIEKKFLEYAEKLHGKFLDKIKDQKQIADEDEKEMKKIIEKFIEAN